MKKKKNPPQAISLTRAPEISLKEPGCIFFSFCIEEINKRSASEASLSLILCFSDDNLQFHLQVFTPVQSPVAAPAAACIYMKAN